MIFSSFDIGTLREFLDVYYQNTPESDLDVCYQNIPESEYAPLVKTIEKDMTFHIDICFVI